MRSITRRRFNQGILGSAALSALPKQALPNSKRPNVLLVIADEWRYQSTGYAGDPNVHMPSIDRFAAESVNCENTIAGCSVCCPSRASLVTGQYPLTHGVYINDVPLTPKGLTLGEAFAKAGYRTGYIGKWHLYGSPGGRWERRESYIPANKRFGFDYWKVAECTHDYNHSLYYENADPAPKYWPGYDAIAQTEDASQFIRRQVNERKPYFLAVSWGPPHFPLETAPLPYQEMYRNRGLVLRPNVPAANKEAAQKDLRGYYAHIAALDDCFRRLLTTLESTGTAEETIVVLTSDHGDMMYSQGLQYKIYPWEESIRIPLLIRYPRRFGQRGKRSTAPVNSPDIMPTLLSLSGIEIPKEVQGIDYSNVLASNGDRSVPASSFINLPVSAIEARSYGFSEYRGVRTERYTYVRSINGPWLLYDNQRDPYQMNNLCGKSEAREIQMNLETDLQSWLGKLHDQFLPAGEYLRRDKLAHYLEPKFPIGYTRSPWGDWESTLSKPTSLSVDSMIRDLLDNPAASAALIRVLPELMSAKDDEWLQRSSLRLLHVLMPQRITDRQFEVMSRELASRKL